MPATRRATCAPLLVGAVGLLVSIGAHPAAAQDGETIRVGFPLELSGKFVAYGSAGKRGAEMALDAFDHRAGPFRIEPLFRDVQSEPQATVSAMTELVVTGGVNYIIGPIASPIVAAAIPVVKQQKPVWLVPGSSSTKLEETMGPEDYFFHVYPYAYHYHDSESAVLKNEVGEDAKRIAVIYSDDNYGRTHLPFVKKFYTEAGFEIVAEELVRANSTDLNPVLTKVSRADPDILIGLVQTTDAVTLAKQLHTRRLDVPYLVGTAYTQLDEWQDAVGEAQEGWLGVTTYLAGMERPASTTHPQVFPKLSQWTDTFRERYGMDPDFLDVGVYAATAMLLLAIEEAGADDKEKVIAALKGLDVETINGRGRFVETDGGTRNQAFTDMVVFQRQGGENVLLYPEEVRNGALQPLTR